MSVVKIAAMTALAFGLSVSASAETGFGSQIGTTGRWTAYVSKDVMTDAATCVALYDDRANVQLTARSIAIGFRGRGGINSYRVRLGDAPPQSLFPASGTEKLLGAIVFEGKRRDAMIVAGRLRLEALTILSTVVTEDISLAEAPEVFAIFSKNGCAVPITFSSPQSDQPTNNPAMDDSDRER